MTEMTSTKLVRQKANRYSFV